MHDIRKVEANTFRKWIEIKHVSKRDSVDVFKCYVLLFSNKKIDRFYVLHSGTTLVIPRIFHRIFERVWHANIGRLLFLTPGPVPFENYICSHVVFSKSVSRIWNGNN